MEPTELSLTVKYGKDTLALSLPASATVQELLEMLETRTGLMARKQKLMTKGKVVSGQPRASLQAAGIASGAKLLLLAAAGTQTQGQAALATQQQQRLEALRQRRQQLGAGKDAAAAAAPAAGKAAAPAGMQQRAAAWAKTGIASVRDMQLEQLPQELFSPGVAGSIRVLDAGGNRLSALPAAVSQLTALQRLRLSSNALTDQGVDWDALGALSQLSVLALDHNRLTALPSSLGQLMQLRQLSLSHNNLTSLPPACGCLTALKHLQLTGNRLAALPPELGSCSSLEEADLSNNCLEVLPAELSRLTCLRTLILDNNKLRTVLPQLLSGCSSLATLSLHENPVTAEQLRETPGYQAFDARRRAKYDKMVDMKVLPGSFDEGADVQLWEHWK